MSSMPSKITNVGCPEDLKKCNIYINEEGMHELLFLSQQAKTSGGTAAMCCFLMFDSNLQTR